MELIALCSEYGQLFLRSGGGGHGGGMSGSNRSSEASTLLHKHGASQASNFRRTTSFSFPGTKVSGTAYTDGGGKNSTLGLSSTFNGHRAGGQLRGTIGIYGTFRFDCGHTYRGSGPYVNNRLFSRYFYPSLVPNNYYGGDEHGDLEHSSKTNLSTNPDSDYERPGNVLKTIIFPPILAHLTPLDLAGCLVRTGRCVSGGAYGDIYKGRCHNKRTGTVTVAIKCFRINLPQDIKTLFEKEIYVWSKLKHDNILPLLGFDFDASTGHPLLVSAWMDNGSAWSYVNAHPEVNPTHLITGIACGLAYLHEKGVVHSDIKSDNVVVSSLGDALICDFGCSRMIAASRSLAKPSSGIKGTTRYLAPELLASVPEPPGHTMKTDIWAFGVTVYELISRQRPYAKLSDHQVIFAIVVGRERPLFTQDLLSDPRYELFLKICSKCWSWAPEERPDMLSISRGLPQSPQRLKLVKSEAPDARSLLLPLRKVSSSQLAGWVPLS